MPKYAIHPGWIRSQADGDEHYIGIGQLVRLYKLEPGEYCVWVSPFNLGRVYTDYVHLFPRDDGNYGRPDGEAVLPASD